jgi:hypothetical protein
MSQTSIRRTLAVFLLALGLLSSTLSAAPLASESPLWSRLIGVLELGWSLVVPKHGCSIDPDGRACVLEAGCSIDPDGQVACAPAPRLGCSIDPNGRPICPPAPKHGCSIDPNGKPVCDSATKAGCSIDPNGKPVCTP